jgi:hypothetical protein
MEDDEIREVIVHDGVEVYKTTVLRQPSTIYTGAKTPKPRYEHDRCENAIVYRQSRTQIMFYYIGCVFEIDNTYHMYYNKSDELAQQAIWLNCAYPTKIIGSPEFSNMLDGVPIISTTLYQSIVAQEAEKRKRQNGTIKPAFKRAKLTVSPHADTPLLSRDKCIELLRSTLEPGTSFTIHKF